MPNSNLAEFDLEETQLELDFDLAFKRCLLQGILALLLDNNSASDYRKAATQDILSLLCKIDKKGMNTLDAKLKNINELTKESC